MPILHIRDYKSGLIYVSHVSYAKTFLMFFCRFVLFLPLAAYFQHGNKQEQHKIHNHGVRFIHDVNMDNSGRNTAAHSEQSDSKLV